MANFKGLDALEDILAIVKDPSKAEAILKEIRKATEDYTTAIEAVVKLSDVNDYTLNIRKKNEEAEAAVANAKVVAQGMIDKARNYAEETKLSVSEQLSQVSIAKSELENKERNLTAMTKDLDTRMAVCIKFEEDLRNMQVQLQAERNEFEQRRSKLMAAIS